MLKCGLLGEKLGHSYSPAIHGMLDDYEYLLYEKSREELPDFLKKGDWKGLNVTIPYKKEVIPFCDELSEVSARTGSVNTLVKRPDGSIYGDSTDVYGFDRLVRHSGISVKDEKVLVLGSGGASAAVCDALLTLDARPVVISRSGENNYSNLDRHADAAVVVNATPVGMYPHNGESPVDLTLFPALKGVLDIVYNPARTALLLQAEELGLPRANGLYMLTAQAKRSSEQFSGREIPDSEICRITDVLAAGMQNIVLVGMPGCGKSTVAALLGQKTGRAVLDSDAEIVQNVLKPIPQIFAEEGEDRFRAYETDALKKLGGLSGKIIATGGGSVLREENYAPLHQNGTIFWLTRDLTVLDREGRPLSQNADLAAMFEKREPRYRRFADWVIDNNGSPEDTVKQILDRLSLSHEE